MLDGVSLDQLRTFIAAADEGSFSAGGRRLRRAQSVVSQTLANLETQLGVKLFDRSSRSPVLTKQGVALLAEARAVVGGMDVFKARAKELSDGKDFGVFSANTWRLADLGAKHAFLRAGLGWGGMPVGVVEADLASGSLAKIRIEDLPEGHLVMAMSAAFRTDTPPGPAGRWLIERLKSNTGPAKERRSAP